MRVGRKAGMAMSGLLLSIMYVGQHAATVSAATCNAAAAIAGFGQTAVPDQSIVGPGSIDGWTVTLINLATDPCTFSFNQGLGDQLRFDLWPGITYLAGSTSGAAIADPVLGSPDVPSCCPVGTAGLVWLPPFSPNVLPPGSSLALHFNVLMPTTPDSYPSRFGAQFSASFGGTLGTDSFGPAIGVLGDTTPPVLQFVNTCPFSGGVCFFHGTHGVVATWTVTATDPDNSPADLTVSCNPPSGSVFQVGTTTVTCVATDPAGNQGTLSFPVYVFHGNSCHPTCNGRPQSAVIP
jgi:hypothetical protein